MRSIVLLVLALAMGQAVAQDATIPALRGKPSKADIARALAKPATPAQPKVRSIVLEDPNAAQSPPQPERRAVDLEVLFEFDSARLTNDGRDVLDALGGALASTELADVRQVYLEGHTDATGSDAYNDSLSLLRAQSARQYLIQRHRIEPGKVRAVGKGRHELADPRDPYSAANRRVRVVVEG